MNRDRWLARAASDLGLGQFLCLCGSPSHPPDGEYPNLGVAVCVELYTMYKREAARALDAAPEVGRLSSFEPDVLQTPPDNISLYARVQ